jgi:hypothetical protein
MEDQCLEAVIHETRLAIDRFKRPYIEKHYNVVLDSLKKIGDKEALKNLGYIAISHYNSKRT